MDVAMWDFVRLSKLLVLKLWNFCLNFSLRFFLISSHISIICSLLFISYQYHMFFTSFYFISGYAFLIDSSDQINFIRDSFSDRSISEPHRFLKDKFTPADNRTWTSAFLIERSSLFNHSISDYTFKLKYKFEIYYQKVLLQEHQHNERKAGQFF